MPLPTVLRNASFCGGLSGLRGLSRLRSVFRPLLCTRYSLKFQRTRLLANCHRRLYHNNAFFRRDEYQLRILSSAIYQRLCITPRCTNRKATDQRLSRLHRRRRSNLSFASPGTHKKLFLGRRSSMISATIKKRYSGLCINNMWYLRRQFSTIQKCSDRTKNSDSIRETNIRDSQRRSLRDFASAPRANAAVARSMREQRYGVSLATSVADRLSGAGRLRHRVRALGRYSTDRDPFSRAKNRAKIECGTRKHM